MFILTPEQLFAFALSGVILSLCFKYFPKFGDWYNSLADNIQRLIVLGAGLVVVLGAFGLTCAAVLALPWACTWLGLYDAMLAYVVFLVANQATYLVLPKPKR